MVLRGRLIGRNRRGRCRWGRLNGWRRRNVEWNCRPKERVQLIQARLPRLLGVRRRGSLLYLIILIGRKILIG
jgi:hypothetical protein